MNNDIKYSSGGFPFFSILAIIFIVLKVLDIITWSWVWVLSPIWVGMICYGIVCIIVIILLKKDIL